MSQEESEVKLLEMFRKFHKGISPDSKEGRLILHEVRMVSKNPHSPVQRFEYDESGKIVPKRVLP